MKFQECSGQRISSRYVHQRQLKVVSLKDSGANIQFVLFTR